MTSSDLATKKMTKEINEIVALDALALIEKIHQRKLSCVEVMEAYLPHIKQYNPTHNALIALQDESQLLEEARQKDKKANIGAMSGLMHGVPQAPKDLQLVAGMPSTRGSLVFKDTIAENDAMLFSRIRDAGAIFVGRSNTPEFGLGGHTYNAVYGTTGNASNPLLSAGGSSGGAGVAVAMHMLPVADGSDMMGSLRTPAAFNGVYGLRPTPGLIPNGMIDPVVKPSLSVAGPMARNIPDLAMLFSVMADFPKSMPFKPEAKLTAFLNPLYKNFKNIRVGWMRDLNGYLPFEKGVLEACEQSLGFFEEIGCDVEAFVPQFNYESLWQAWIDLRSYLFFKNNALVLSCPKNYALIKPEAQWEFERGKKITDQKIAVAKRVRHEWVVTLARAFQAYDFLLLPSTQVFPFSNECHWPSQLGEKKMDSYHRWMEVVIPASMGGTPALSVPVEGNLITRRTGIQIIAPPYAELAVLQLSHAYDLARF